MIYPDLSAFLGRDEFGSGVIGIKQGRAAAGIIPLVAINREKMEKLRVQIEEQARQFGQRIYLCNYKFNGVVWETTAGVAWDS